MKNIRTVLWPFLTLGELWDWLRDFFERGQRGYCKRDIWNFHVYLLKVKIGGLTCLREHGVAYPASLESEVEWGNILTTMIEGFQVALSLTDDLDEPDDSQKKQIAEAFKLWQEWFFDLWD